MRNNQPVTDREIQVRDDALIVTKTDLKGRITYVSRDFVEVSGYAEQELIGEPHNIVRHPDMPEEAFGDLWAALKQHRPWSGLVKNRTKNGDHYWVNANVTPIWENGQVTGYLSARTRAEPARVAMAEQVYRRFREGRAAGLAIRSGQVVRTGLLARALRALRDMSLSLKLVLASAVLLAVVMSIAVTILSVQVKQGLEKEGIQTLQDKLAFVNGAVSSAASSARKESARLAAILMGQFAGDFSIADGDKDVPTLKSGGLVLNQRNNEIDRYAAWTNASATVLVRKGDDFIRIATTNRDATDKRLVGTRLGAGHPATAALLGGKPFVGRTVVEGREHYSAFLPVKDASEKVIGAIGTGRSFHDEMQALKQQIKSIKLGATGYFYVLDARPGKDYGKLVVHPAKEGENLIGARDAANREFIKEMLEKKQGRIVYPWLNKELGDLAARDKIVLYDHFPEWNWVIAGGTYVDEFYGLTDSVRRALILVSLGVVMLLAFLIAWLDRATLKKPLEEVLRVFRAIASGDYRNALDVARNDEIGKVLQGLHSMQTRLGFEVTQAKRVGEEMARVKSALDGAAVPMTLTTSEGVLVYQNEAAEALWTLMEPEMRKQHPEFSARGLLGGRLSRYVTDPEVQKTHGKPLEDRKIFHFELGGRGLRVIATPVRGPGGQYLGRATQWIDRTDEIRIESEVAAIIRAATEGDFGRRLDATQMTGFYRQISEGINELLESNGQALTAVGDMLSRLAQGDLTRKIDADYRGMLGRLKDDANATVDNLREILGSIRHATEAINTAAKEIASGNADLSARTEEQASSLEETASSMEQLTGTVKQNAENAARAHELAVAAQSVAVRGGEVVGEVVMTMGAIHQASSRIADIIGVIDSIAFQTNILALNAAVEAARAGEQGRGFAVVATEVRNLAQRSAAAAKEIKGLISDSVSKVQDGNRLAESAGQTMDEVVASIRRVNGIVTEIATASREQSSGIEQVGHAVGQMDEVTQQNAALVEQAAAAAESLEEQARELTRSVGVFRLNEMPKGRALPQFSGPAGPREKTAARAKNLLPPPRSDARRDWQEF